VLHQTHTFGLSDRAGQCLGTLGQHSTITAARAKSLVLVIIQMGCICIICIILACVIIGSSTIFEWSVASAIDDLDLKAA